MIRPLHAPDPALDLVLERTTDVRPELVWQAWTRQAMHRDKEGRDKHNEMGFFDGWGRASISWRRWRGRGEWQRCVGRGRRPQVAARVLLDSYVP